MYHIDPGRLDLVEEFKARPFGPFSHELARLLNRMRLGGNQGRYVLVCTKRHEEWVLGQLTGRRGDKIALHEDQRFDNLAEAEWEVFRRRWRHHTGGDVNDLVGAPRFAPGNVPARR